VRNRRQDLHLDMRLRRQELMGRVLSGITTAGERSAFLDALAPEHETKDCSDKSWSGNYNDNNRCLRCFLLEAFENGWPLGAKAILRIMLE
jgi:hypothetical protein